MKTIVKMLFGSHLYGTNTPSSDTDMKSVHIPDASDILLQRVKSEIPTGGRAKKEGEKNLPTDVDDKSYSLQAFLDLAAEGQTVAIDMLFAPKEMIEESSGWWRYIQQNRHRLLTKKSASFLGYCRQQANKYGIKGSRVAAARDSSEIFLLLSKTMGPQAKVADFYEVMNELCEKHHDHMNVITLPVGSSGQMGMFLDCCGRKVSFSASVKQAAEIFTRIFENYGDRARKAESNEGVDWKALSHAVRVGQEAIELLTNGEVLMPRAEAAYLVDIKLGKLPYEEVSSHIEELLIQVEEAAKHSVLPDEVDREWIDETVQYAYYNRVISEMPVSKGNLWKHEVYGERPMIDHKIEDAFQ